MGEGWRKTVSLPLCAGALGVVFGDIGTSPIYTLRQSFRAAGAEHAPEAVLGVLSLVFWTILLIVALKYVVLVMRADVDGEGGIVPLLTLATRDMGDTRGHRTLALLGIAGAALFYGDGMITPAISVLSAVEGLDVATPVLHRYVVPITLAILVGLFLIQRRGSDVIGRFFGPVMLAWFAAISLAGLWRAVRHPTVFGAVWPGHAIGFILHQPGTAFVALGSVFLAVTGAEALYADMGQFSRSSIRLDWFALVLPALLLNYAGQGAAVLTDPAAFANPFFALAPGWTLYPMVALSALATVIASQAVISGAFSLTQQAMQVGLVPRLQVKQTSEEHACQVYVPQINWTLTVVVIGLVLSFRSSDALGAAYGIAVTGTMVVTTVLLGVVMRRVWRWGWLATAALAGPLLALTLLFFAANALKIPDGGWFPLLVGAVVFLLMTTWRSGRKLVLERQDEEAQGVLPYLDGLHGLSRVPGTAVYLTTARDQIPSALVENVRHNHVLHDQVVLLTVATERQPRVAEAGRVDRLEVAPGVVRVTLKFGFGETPDVPACLRAHQEALHIDPDTASFFTGRELPVPKMLPDMSRWRAAIFAYLTRNAAGAADYFRIPTRRVIELGTKVEL